MVERVSATITKECIQITEQDTYTQCDLKGASLITIRWELTQNK